MADRQRVLVVDDEESIRRLLAYSLGKSGYDVAEASDGASALVALEQYKPDLIILDVMMPVMDGREVLMRLRSSKDAARMPVIMLTARGSDADKVQGLEMGADDYVSKPFSVNELLARVRALLRRASPHESETSGARVAEKVSAGALTLDLLGRRAYLKDIEIALTLKEFDLISFLVRNLGRAFSREQLLGEVWGYDYFGDMRTVDVHITHLRAKMGQAAGMIETVRGIGYRMGYQESEGK